MQNRLILIFEHLAGHFGPLHWWPADSPFEVALGAVLTQNTAWRNVERAIANLRAANALTPEAVRALPQTRFEALIRPAGFFRQKAEHLGLFVKHLFAHHEGSLEALLAAPMEEARRELLRLKGIGPETADSILLYAGGHPSFVVDAYTRRLFGRLGLLDGAENYEAVRMLFMHHLPPDVDMFNEYHALIVEECKTFCLKRAPRCAACPLLEICPTGLANAGSRPGAGEGAGLVGTDDRHRTERSPRQQKNRHGEPPGEDTDLAQKRRCQALHL